MEVRGLRHYRNMKKPYDVTLSCFNILHFRELAYGLANSGHSVASIGTCRSMQGAARHKMVFLAFLLMYVGAKARTIGIQYSAMDVFTRLAPFHLKSTKAVWGLCGVSHRLFKRAKRMRLPVIADSAGVHKRKSLEMLIKEHKNWGIPYPEYYVAQTTRLAEKEYELADYIVGGSTQVRNSYLERGFPSEKILVNPYGVNTTLWNKVCHNDLNLDGPMVFVYTASIQPRKGIQYLLEAWKMLQPKNAELWICGSGNMDIVEIFSPLQPSVRMLGQKTHEELTKIYALGHVYVLPSLLEGLARSGIEAMAAGLAPIVTLATGLGDYIQHEVNGWLVSAQSADALAERIEYCIQNPDTVARTRNEASKISGKLSLEEYGRRSSEILEAVITNAQPSIFPSGWSKKS